MEHISLNDSMYKKKTFKAEGVLGLTSLEKPRRMDDGGWWEDVLVEMVEILLCVYILLDYVLCEV